MTQDYKAKLEDAEEFQDFVSEKLRSANPCIIIQAYCSKKYQRSHGESASGIEIKHDRRINGEDGNKPTRNIYIETSEKPYPEYSEFIPSGILRNDNTWLYLVGDYTEAFLFSKKMLFRIYIRIGEYKDIGLREVSTPTSQGFVIPTNNPFLESICLQHFVWDEM